MTNDNATIVLEINDDEEDAEKIAAQLTAGLDVRYVGIECDNPFHSHTHQWTTHRFVGSYDELRTVAERWLYGEERADSTTLDADLADAGVTIDRPDDDELHGWSDAGAADGEADAKAGRPNEPGTGGAPVGCVEAYRSGYADGYERAFEVCPDHGQVLVDRRNVGATRGPDPYAIDRLTCGCDVVALGPGPEDVCVVRTRR